LTVEGSGAIVAGLLLTAAKGRKRSADPARIKATSSSNTTAFLNHFCAPIRNVAFLLTTREFREKEKYNEATRSRFTFNKLSPAWLKMSGALG
jgi:hypothetical protein